MKISTATLLKVYTQHRITRKGLRYVKTLRIKNPESRQQEILSMKEKVLLSKSQGRKIIFVDEAVFTTSTFPDRGYAHRGENVVFEEKFISTPALAEVAGVSAEGGLEGLYMQERSIDSDAFIQYLLHLVTNNDPRSLTVFLVRAFVESNSIQVIFNVPYGPEFNPIERVWA